MKLVAAVVCVVSASVLMVSAKEAPVIPEMSFTVTADYHPGTFSAMASATAKHYVGSLPVDPDEVVYRYEDIASGKCYEGFGSEGNGFTCSQVECDDLPVRGQSVLPSPLKYSGETECVKGSWKEGSMCDIFVYGDEDFFFVLSQDEEPGLVAFGSSGIIAVTEYSSKAGDMPKLRPECQ